MRSAVVLGMLLLAAPGSCVLPQHGWTTLSEQVFYHSSNISGPFAAGANDVIAKHRMVTIEKWMDENNGEDMSKNIVSALTKVKMLNPNITTILYMNSVCDFPQYKSLYDQFNAMPQYWLKNTKGEVIKESCAGWSDMPVFDFSVAAVRDLWSSLCLNATNAGVDGCFIDRAVDGMPNNVSSAYVAGHMQVIEDLQTSVGPDKVIIANHGYTFPTANAAMLEFCSAEEATITDLQECEQSKKICQCHSGKADISIIAAYLIGAYSGEGYGSYFGFGPWRATTNYTPAWDAATLPDYYYKPLGSPLGPAVKVGDVWSRSFASVNVTLNVTSGVGEISSW